MTGSTIVMRLPWTARATLVRPDLGPITGMLLGAVEGYARLSASERSLAEICVIHAGETHSLRGEALEKYLIDLPASDLTKDGEK